MDQLNVDQNQFLKQVRERAQVLSKNARQNPDEVVEKVSSNTEEDKELKDYLDVIRSTEKEDSGSIEAPKKMDSDDFDFASQLACSSQLDFSKERFKAGLAQRRVQKRRRPQSWAWIATTDNDAVKIKDPQGPTDMTLNVSIQMDEDRQPVEVPKKTTRPMNRFSSPMFSDKLMSDLGSALNKKKSPLGKPSAPTPSKSPKNVSKAAESSASQILKSKSPVLSPRSASPMTPPSESPQHTLRESQSASPSLVLVTERDVFGLQESPILHRQLKEGGLRQFVPEPGNLRSSGAVGANKMEISVKEEDESKDTKISSDSADALKHQHKPPPPKPKTKLKTGQSSAMLVKNAAEQSKTDVAKEEEKRPVKAKPRWLDELQKKKVKCARDSSEAGLNKGPSMTQNCNQVSSNVTSLSSGVILTNDESVAREKEPTKVESPKNDLPAWMKLEFSKMKKGPDMAESGDLSSPVDKTQENYIEHLIKKPKATEPSKPSWLDELNKRKKKQVLGIDDSMKESDTNLKVSEHFDYRSHEEMKQKDQKGIVDEDSETDGAMKSISDIKMRLNEKNIGCDNQFVIRKMEPLAKPNLDGRVGKKYDSSAHDEITHDFGKVATPESFMSRDELVGGSERDERFFESKSTKNESKTFLLESPDIMDKLGSNGDDSNLGGNKILQSATLDEKVAKRVGNSVGEKKDHTLLKEVSKKDENELSTEKPTYRLGKIEHSGLENRFCENAGSKNLQRDVMVNPEEMNESVSVVDLSKKDVSPKYNTNVSMRNISSEDRSESSFASSSNCKDTTKLEDAIEKETLIRNDRAHVNNTEVKTDLNLEMGERGGNEEDMDRVCSSVTSKGTNNSAHNGEGTLTDADDKAVKMSNNLTVSEKPETMVLSESVENAKNLVSNNLVERDTVCTYPEQHLDNGRSKYEAKEEEKTKFPKPLRRKLVHINSFDQAISKSTNNETLQKNGHTNTDEKKLYAEQGSTSDVKKAKEIESKGDVRSKDRSKNYSSIERGKEIDNKHVDVDLSLKTEFDHSCDKNIKLSNTKQENANVKDEASFQDARKVHSPVKTEAYQAGIILETRDNGECENSAKKSTFDFKKENSLVTKDDSSKLREKTNLLTDVSDVDKETGSKGQKLSDVLKDTSVDNVDSGNKQDVCNVKTEVSLPEKERKPPVSIKKPPAPKPKPKPKQRPPLRNATEIKNSMQKEDKVKVTQIENLKNIEKSKSSQELKFEKEQSNERVNEQHGKAIDKVEVTMRKKDENSKRQHRPVSMFENVSALPDSNFPMRERKFSGISSGTKFSIELEKKQKSCWFRGAMDTNDVKSVDDYDGDDDIPAWKRQLLAKLKSNEGSNVKKSERGKGMDDQKRDEASNFRSRTVTSPDGFSTYKKITARKSPVIEEATGDNMSQNEENDRELPAFLLEFASKKQLKAQRESGLPKMQEEKKDGPHVMGSKSAEFV